jgi:hypothetical protein
MAVKEDFLSQKFAIYVLGAGFSRAAGLPLAPELWNEVRRRGLSLSGRGEYFRDDLEAYIEYRRKCDQVELTVEQVDLEEFMAFLDIEFHLGLRGKETWSSDGNETQVIVKTLIGEILTERMPARDRIPDLFLQFAEILKPNDYVLTFNYDVLLERALEKARIPFRLFPDRYKTNPYDGKSLLVDTSKPEVVVLKLHGSIDWFDRTRYAQLGRSDLVFENSEKLVVVSLLEGTRFADDPLRETYRVQDIETLYRRRLLFRSTPSLLNPSSMKILYSQLVRDFWWGLGDAGVLNFGMAIIGFSLPPQDEYARQVIYRLVTNYQNTYWEEETLEHRKTPLVLIDLRQSTQDRQELQRRYAFVDWSKAETCFTGFDESALRLLDRTNKKR